MPRRSLGLPLHHALAVIALALATAACGDGGGGGSVDASPSSPSGAAPLAVAVAPSSNRLTTLQPLVVSITVTGGALADAPAGSVSVQSGPYASAPIALSGGKASITIPAGVLAEGTDDVVAKFTPNATSATSVSGSATVTVAAAAPASVTASSTSVAVDGHPFQATSIGSTLFVSVNANDNPTSVTGIRVYDTSSGQPVFRCTQLLDPSIKSAQGFALAPDGRSIAVAGEDAGLDVVTMLTAAANCASGNVVVPQGSASSAQGSFSAAYSNDGRYAFVANEYGSVANDGAGKMIGGNVGVVALRRDAGGQITGGSLVGQFSTGGQAVANVTVSPDGTRLYVTSEIARAGTSFSAASSGVLAHGGCMQGDGPGQPNGLLTVVDVAKAEANPSKAAIIANVAAGCSPVRVVETSDNQVIWVAARGDNRVLAFSTQMLETSPDNALLGYADTGGVAPVGLQLFRGGTLLAVANSNRFATPSAVGSMTILTATPVHPLLLRTVAASFFPRTLSVAADDKTLYLTNYNAGAVQVIATGQ